MTLPLAALLQGAVAGGPTGQTYVDDVFSTYLYTGNGSTQTITNGIDLAGKGGMVWTKKRSGGYSHYLYDTSRGVNVSLNSDDTSANDSGANELTAFNATGFDLGTSANVNGNTATYVSWTFRKAPKFFDVVTYTGNGGTKVVPHSIGSAPGMIVVKRTDTTGDWVVYHQSVPANCGFLNLTNSFASAQRFSSVTSSDFTINVSTADVNASGGTYVAYLFAHDAGTDGIIQCGTETWDGSGISSATLGWEPQYVLIKSATSVHGWWMVDNMRGMPTDTGGAQLNAESSIAENASSSLVAKPTATGFRTTNGAASQTYIYLAIRRPNKPPTSGTQVYNAIAYTANDTDGRKLSGIGFPPDLVSIDPRSSYITPGGPNWFSRLTGNGRFLTTASTSAELDGSSNSNGILGQDDFTVSRTGTNVWSNVGSYLYILHAFRRAPGVFDQVCYTGTGVAHTEAHNLGVVPELMIVKNRANGYAGAYDWAVYHKDVVNTKRLVLNTGAAPATGDAWNSTSPSASVFTVGTINSVNFDSTCTYTAYLFATKAGISKVGSYTGNGSNQTINCGFTTGARFILIKRTDSTGDWFVWDSVRGIIAGNDPHLSLNTTAAEVTTDDSIDPDTSGFIVNQDAATNINVNAATYIYLSLA